jgi:NAD(P)H-nitrite reductase large subunit
MEALAARGVHLSVVEMGDRMVPRMMGPTAGGMIRDWCEAKGVKSSPAPRSNPSRRAPLSVKLSNGNHVADLVISAAGCARPSVFWRTPVLTCLLGVLTDEHLQTNVPAFCRWRLRRGL